MSTQTIPGQDELFIARYERKATSPLDDDEIYTITEDRIIGSLRCDCERGETLKPCKHIAQAMIDGKDVFREDGDPITLGTMVSVPIFTRIEYPAGGRTPDGWDMYLEVWIQLDDPSTLDDPGYRIARLACDNSDRHEIGAITRYDGRNALRVMVLSWVAANEKVACKTQGHNRAHWNMLIRPHIKDAGKSIRSYKIGTADTLLRWTTGTCLACRVNGPDDDLIPEV